jgi:hypothetical protein
LFNLTSPVTPFGVVTGSAAKGSERQLPRAVAFYDAVLALCIERVPSKYEKWAAWHRPGEAPKLWVGFPYSQLPASWGNGWMAALSAPTRAGVDAAYAAAMANGGYDRLSSGTVCYLSG